MGDIVKGQIDQMLGELKNLNGSQKRKIDDVVQPSSSKGTIANRFTKETVVITASTKVKTSYDLQLPSMVPLTSKSSSQVFFLRVLRVIVNIRHSIKQTLKNGKLYYLLIKKMIADLVPNIFSLQKSLHRQAKS